MIWRILNALRGYGFSMRTYTDLSGREFHSLTPWCGTCPYPTRHNWSARACILAGDCGCDEREIRG